MKRLVASLAMLALTAAPASAIASTPVVPSEPRLAFVQWKLKEPTRTLLFSIGGDGFSRTALGSGGIEPVPFGAPSWFLDGSRLAFAGYRPGAKKEEQAGGREPSGIYLLPAEGGTPTLVPGTRGASHPVVSPNGTAIVFARSRLRFHFNPKDPLDFHSYSSTTTWIVPVAGGGARRLTPWRNGLHNEPTSFSPDGSLLLLERSKGQGPEVVGMDTATGSTRVLVREAEGAVYSPDGSRIAFVSYSDHILSDVDDDPDGLHAKSELYVMAADGSGLRRLTRSRDWQEEEPSWDPSGQRLAYTRTTGPEFLSLGFTNVVMEVNAGGACPTILYGSRRKEGSRGPGLYGPAWQPGPGREAGAIVC